LGGTTALAHGWNGCWRRWNLTETSHMWSEAVALTGHQDVVKAVCWSPNGEYLISTR
jgi:elongator complex protein 2/cytochrome c oxidase assembly factor 5